MLHHAGKAWTTVGRPYGFFDISWCYPTYLNMHETTQFWDDICHRKPSPWICSSPLNDFAPCTRYQRRQNQGCSWHIGCPPGDVTRLTKSDTKVPVPGSSWALTWVPPPPFPPKLGDKNSWYSLCKNSQNDTYWLMAELSQHPKTQKALKRAPNWPLIILFWGGYHELKLLRESHVSMTCQWAKYI